MEDLFPLLIFLVIIAVNAIKFFAEKGKPKKPAQQPGEAPPKRPAASSIETFFESLAEQMAPKKTELPDWPEGYERPDYAHEMEEFEHAQTEEPEEVQPTEILPEPPPPPPAPHPADQGIGIRIKGRENLKQMMLAHIIFSPPRAFDLSFKNTIAK